VDGAAVVSNLSNKIVHAAEGNQSVFAWGHLNDLHAPLHPDKVKSGDLFAGSSRNLFAADYRRLTQQLSPGYNAAYHSVLQYIDNQIRNLVEELKYAGLWEQTILIVTADHGEALADRGYYGHPPHYLFNDCLHVPLVVRIPGIDATRVNAPFSLAYLHELIADILDVSRFDLPATSERSSHIVDPEECTVIADSLTGIGYSVSFIDQKKKYIRFVQDTASLLNQQYATEWIGELRETTTWEWNKGIEYNLTSDPGEHNPSNPVPTCSQYQKMAKELKNSISPARSSDEDLPSEVKDLLKEIGYIN
jgi:choline-sulfatase